MSENQCCGSIVVSMRIRIQGFDDQKLENFYSWKYNFYVIDKKNAFYLSLGLHKKERPSCRKSLHPSKENIRVRILLPSRPRIQGTKKHRIPDSRHCWEPWPILETCILTNKFTRQIFILHCNTGCRQIQSYFFPLDKYKYDTVPIEWFR